MAKNHWARREMRRHWRHLFFPNARQPGTHKHTHRDETSSIPFYTACKIYINMSVASLTDGQIVPGLLRFCRRLSKCPKGGGGINSALAGLAGILHIGWRWERKNEHRSYTYLIFPRLSLMCVPSHCIPNLLRLSFLLFTPVSRVSVPFTRDQQHTSSGTSPPPPLCLSLVTVQFPSTIPSLSYGKASHDSRLGISQNGKLTAAAARPVSVRFFNSWRWTVRPIKCASFTLFSFPFLFFSFFSFQLRSFVFFFKRGGTAFQNVNGTLWN
jgi:hypothetical protein